MFEEIFDKMRVLIVDDEVQILKVLERILQKEGATVLSAVNGADGLKMAIEEDFDLMLIDVIIPDLSVQKIVSAIKEQRPEILPRMIFMTGNPYSETCQQLSQITNATFLAKPFHLSDLREIFRSAVNRVRSIQENE